MLLSVFEFSRRFIFLVFLLFCFSNSLLCREIEVNELLKKMLEKKHHKATGKNLKSLLTHERYDLISVVFEGQAAIYPLRYRYPKGIEFKQKKLRVAERFLKKPVVIASKTFYNNSEQPKTFTARLSKNLIQEESFITYDSFDLDIPIKTRARCIFQPANKVMLSVSGSEQSSAEQTFAKKSSYTVEFPVWLGPGEEITAFLLQQEAHVVMPYYFDCIFEGSSVAYFTHRPPTGKIHIYNFPYMKGWLRTWDLAGEILRVPDFGQFRIDNNCSSLQIIGPFVVFMYENRYFQGRRIFFSGDANYVGNRFNDRFSSMIVSPTFVQLFEGVDFSGKDLTLAVTGEKREIPELGDSGFNDICSSLKVYGPIRVELFERTFFEGRKLVFSGDVEINSEILRKNGFNNKISSIKILPKSIISVPFALENEFSEKRRTYRLTGRWQGTAPYYVAGIISPPRPIGSRVDLEKNSDSLRDAVSGLQVQGCEKMYYDLSDGVINEIAEKLKIKHATSKRFPGNVYRVQPQ
ncbi:hypothetical protein ACFL35_01205 [Candidatus Riflebacteria bacterium]